MDEGGLKVLSTVLCVYQILICPSALSLSFRTQPVSVVERRGGSVQLLCVVYPSSASLTWLFQGQSLEPGALPGVEVQPGSLSLPSLQPVHVGSYQCVAHTDAGTIASRLAWVSIADIGEFRETHRRSLTATKGDSTVIECQLPWSKPPSLPRYRIRGQWIEKSTDEYLILPSGNLQIVSVSTEHQGLYKCGAYNPVSRETRTEAHGTRLIVKDSDVPSPVGISYPISPVVLDVERSAPLLLECAVSGRSSSTVTWRKDGREVPLSGRVRVLHTNLAVSEVQLSDAGHYTCSIHAEDGTTSTANYTVRVLGAASVLRGLSDQTMTAGSSVLFTCVAGGNPAPKITWLFNSSPVSPSPRLQISDSSLHISSITVQDQGMYQCLLDNGIGSEQSAARLIVQSEPQTTPTPVAVETDPSVHSVQSDDGEELFPPLEEGLGDGVGPPTERSSDKPTPEAPIIVSPPQTHKSNTYDLEWRAGRDWGSPINAYFVKYRKVDDTGTTVGSWYTVRVPGSEKSLVLSDLVPSSLYEVLMVARSTAGEGQPAMLTFRTGRERNSPSSKNPSKAPAVSVPAVPPEDRTVNTHYGVVVHDRVPEAPDRPTISMATESSVYVTWIPRANGGSPITAFRVEYRKQGRSGDWIIADDNISPLKLSVEVRNLEPGSAYRFRVIAMNIYGESPHSAPSRPYHVPLVSTPVSNRPVTGPHIISTEAITDSQIRVRWTYTPSSNNNTPIQGFYIYYRPTDSDNDSDYKRDVVEGIKRWHTIGPLQPETSYDIKMQCFNDAGKSDYSNVMICETRARQSPGRPSQQPVTPPGVRPPEPPSSPAGLLYLIVGCVLGVMVLILLIFIIMCLWRNRQHKYDPPGYLYQPAELNGHMLECPTLVGPGRVSAGGRAVGVAQTCHHLHHKLPNGLALLNGTGPLYPPGHGHAHDGPLYPPGHGHAHDGSLLHGTMDYEHPHPHPHPHHLHNGGVVYTTLPQTDSSDCMNCQNFCNNNRCYPKASDALSRLHALAQRQPDTLELLPLSIGTTGHRGNGGLHASVSSGQETPEEEDASCTPSQNSSCALGEVEPGPGRGSEELVHCIESNGPVVCWERLQLPDSDCKEKIVWISTGSLQ